MSEIKPVSCNEQPVSSDEPVYRAALEQGLRACEELFERDYFGNHDITMNALHVTRERFSRAASAYEALENERDELKQSLDDLQERFNGIKFIESELRKELEEFEVERNRRDEMRKALEAQMGISNKWQS